MAYRQGYLFNDISGTPGGFPLEAGQYGVTVVAGTWNSGVVTMEKLAGDGTTYVTCLTAFSGVDGYSTVNLPAGTYRFSISAASGVYIQVEPVVDAG
jgi:hypothetical protein